MGVAQRLHLALGVGLAVLLGSQVFGQPNVAIVQREEEVILAPNYLGDSKEVVAELVEVALQDINLDVRIRAAEALARKRGHAEEAIPVLVNAAIKGESTWIRARAIEILLRIEGNLKNTEEEFAVAPEIKNKGVHKRGENIFYKLGPFAKSVVPELVAALKDSREEVRIRALEALGQMREHGKNAVPDLAVALKDKSEIVKIRALEALGRLGKNAESAIPVLVAQLKDENLNVRRGAVELLVGLGPHAKSAWPDLLNALVDKKNKYSEEELRKHSNLLASIEGKEIPVIPQETEISTEPSYVCPRLCGLADSIRSQALGVGVADFIGYAKKVPESAESAYSSLDALFVVKASAICRSNENTKFTESVLNYYLKEQSEENKKRQRVADEEDFSSLKIYNKQFHLLLLKDFMSRRLELSINETRLQVLAKSYQSYAESLSRDFGRFDGVGGGSAMNVFAQACSVIAGCGESKIEKSYDFKKATNELIELAALDHLGLPYSLAKGFSPEQKTGSATRAVPVNLLIYLIKKQDKKSRDNLIDALDNYNQKKEILVRNTLLFKGTHNPKQEGVAPYYFYSSIPYAMSALRILKIDPRLNSKQIEKIDGIEKELKTLLVRLFDDKNKGLQPQEILGKRSLYEASPRYATALGGLALLATYGDGCAEFYKLPPTSKEAPRIGILSGIDLYGLDFYFHKTLESSVEGGPIAEGHKN
jgi:HEAT repeat protein